MIASAHPIEPYSTLDGRKGSIKATLEIRDAAVVASTAQKVAAE